MNFLTSPSCVASFSFGLTRITLSKTSSMIVTIEPQGSRKMTVKKSNLTFLEPKDDYQFLRLVCQVALHDLEYALDMINKRLASKARNHRLHQVSYLAGLVSGAILLRMKPRALEKEIQDLLKTYGTRKNSEPLS